jgi:hypothetical protein
MNSNSNSLNKNLNNLNHNMSNTINNMNHRLAIMEARIHSSHASGYADAIQPLPDATGNVPPNFPNMYGSFDALTEPMCQQFLQSYGESRLSHPMAKCRLRLYLGISL